MLPPRLCGFSLCQTSAEMCCTSLFRSACIYAAGVLEELHAAPQWLLLGGSGRSAAPGDALGALSAGGPGLVLLGLINRHLNL